MLFLLCLFLEYFLFLEDGVNIQDEADSKEDVIDLDDVIDLSNDPSLFGGDLSNIMKAAKVAGKFVYCVYYYKERKQCLTNFPKFD